MRQISNKRIFFLIAAIAVGLALLVLLVSHANPGHAPAYLIILPIVFIGLLPFTARMSRLEFARRALAPEEPAQPASFKRPPPLLRR